MASVPEPGPLERQPPAVLLEFVARHYEASGARQFGMDEAALAALLAEVAGSRDEAADGRSQESFLAALHLEELVLARACAAGDERAWEIFLTRYRVTLFETAYKIAHEESAARELADSLYAELYGVNARGEQRTSKLLYYQGRGSLQGWLRMVVAQEYINRYRGARRETSLDAAVEGGAQFEAQQPESATADARVDAAVQAELAALEAEERFLLASYYLDHRTLAEIAKVMRVHESTISRRLERVTAGLRKRIVRRMMQAGMTARQAEEAMQDVDVRDLQVKVDEALRQGMAGSAFYKKDEPQG